MKRCISCILIAALCSMAGCTLDTYDVEKAPGTRCVDLPKTDPNVTPVVFVHGLLSAPGETFYSMYEHFASQGFPEERMHVALMPKIGSPVLGGDSRYACYTFVTAAPYDRRDWEDAGNTSKNVPALMEQIISLLDATGAEQVDLVGHSNGNAVIRELISYANNPSGPRYDDYKVLEHRIRKVVFLAGYASVIDADTNSILTYLDDVAPDSMLPADVEYYSVQSETDMNTNGILQIYKYLFSLPDDFDWNIFVVPGAVNYTIEFVDDGGNHTGVDHQRIPTHPVTIKTVFKWLTGADYVNPPAPATVGIAGSIIIHDNIHPDDCPSDNPCDQYAIQYGKVSVKYYDPSTGLETGFGGSSVISDARYSINGLDPSRYFKIIIERYEDASGGNVIATSVYFLADRVRRNSRALDFSAPRVIESDNENGKVQVRIVCGYSFISCYSYTCNKVRRDNDHYSGRIEAAGCRTMHQDSACITHLPPLRFMSILLRNFGMTNVQTGNEYNFIDPYNLGCGPGYKNNYASKDIYVTADLQRTGVKTRVRINGADRSNNISNYIMYLYRD